jgi:uncharacterized membrane protein YphA (DoxX/SURF4 family)
MYCFLHDSLAIAQGLMVVAGFLPRCATAQACLLFYQALLFILSLLSDRKPTRKEKAMIPKAFLLLGGLLPTCGCVFTKRER